MEYFGKTSINSRTDIQGIRPDKQGASRRYLRNETGGKLGNLSRRRRGGRRDGEKKWKILVKGTKKLRSVTERENKNGTVSA